MDDKWLHWILPVVYLILNIIFCLFLLRIIVWLTLYIIKKKSGVEITFTGVWFTSVRHIRVQWSKGEIGVNDLNVSLCLLRSKARRRWIHLDASQVYCIAVDASSESTQASGGGAPPHSTAGKSPGKGKAIMKKKRLWKLLAWWLRKSAKIVDVTIGNTLIDWPCSVKHPFSVALSLQDLSILATPNSNQCNGINVICDVGKATGKLIAEDENPSSDSGDVLRASFIGQLVLQLLLNSDRPIKLLQFTVVPVSLYVFEELIGSLIGKTAVVGDTQTDTSDGVNNTSDDRNNTSDDGNNTSSDRNSTSGDGNYTSDNRSDAEAEQSYLQAITSLLPQKTEMFLEDFVIMYLTSDDRKLSIKMSRLLMSVHTPTASSISGEMVAHKLKVFGDDSNPAISISVMQHTSEVSLHHISNLTLVGSTRGIIKDHELIHWIKHFRTIFKTETSSSLQSSGTPVKTTGSSSSVLTKALVMVMDKLPSSVAMTTTFKAVDWQVEYCLSDSSPKSQPHPFCRLLLASLDSTTHISQDRTSRNSIRVEDVYLYCPDSESGRGPKCWYDDDIPSIPPSSHQHVWGRVVAIGTYFMNIVLKCPHQKVCPGDNIEGSPLTVDVECEVTGCAVEWSPITCESVVTLLNYIKRKHGLLATTPPSSTLPPLAITHHFSKLQEALKNVSFRLNVSNFNLFVVDPAEYLYFILFLHSDVIRLRGRERDLPPSHPESHPPATPPTDPMCTASQSSLVELECSGCICSCDVFEELSKTFPCLSMRDLPPGLVETPTLSAFVKSDNTLPHISVKGGDFTINWTTFRHCTIKHIVGLLLEDFRTVKKTIPFWNQAAIPTSLIVDTPPNPQPLPLSEYTSKLSDLCSVSLDVSMVTLNITVNRIYRFSGVAHSNSLSLLKGDLQCVSKEVEAVFDKNKIVCLNDFSATLLDQEDPVLERTKFPSLSAKNNCSLELAASSVLVLFPQGYNFSESFEKLMAVRKFLRKIHSSPGQHSSKNPIFITPDLYLRVDVFSFQLQDQEFEAKLRSKQLLMSSDWSHKLEFVKALQLKIEEIELQQGKKLSSKKKQELYELLESQLYCDQAKIFYDKHTLDQKLFEIRFEGLMVSLLSDPSMVGKDNMVLQMKDIDPKSPHPPDLELTTLWGWYMSGRSKQFKLLFRDFPNPLLSQSDVNMSGRTLIVEEESVERATRSIVIQCDKPWESVTVVKKMAALKLYHDWTWKCKVSVGSWGSCYDPVLAQINVAFEKVVRKSIDPSKPLPFWDKMRLAFHGPFKMSAQQAQLVLLASRDPYNTVEYLDCHCSHLQLKYDTGVLQMNGGLDVSVHTASKYDECQILHVPKAAFQANLKWVCRGNPNAHHKVMPCAPDKVPVLPPGEVYDSFAEFRSQNLNLELNLELHPGHDKNSKSPTLVIYASTLRWLQSLVDVLFRRVSRPVRKGKVFQNIKPKRSPFSRHLNDVDITFACHNSIFCYWGSIVQQRGAKVHLRTGEISLAYHLSLDPFNDGLIRRPRANWNIISCHGKGEDIKVLVCNGEEQRVEKAPDFYQHLKHDQNLFQHFFTMSKFSYLRLAQSREEPLSPDLQLTMDYKHQLQTSNTKVLWTNVTKEVIFGLFETYRKSQELKDNLTADALKPLRYTDPPGRQPHMEGLDHSSGPENSPSGTGNSPSGTLRDSRHRSPGNNMLAQLILDVNRYVEHSDEYQGGRDPELKGKQACSADDIAEQTWLIQLRNTQLAFQGVETGGCVLVSSSLTHVTNHKHHPQLNQAAEPVEKATWIARVEDMQYFATIWSDMSTSVHDNIPWLSLSTVSGEPPEPPSEDDTTSMTEVDSEQDINNILIGSLGPRTGSHASLSPTPSSSTSFKDPLFSKGMSGRHGEVVGGLVLSTARGLEGEFVHLQRLASRCYCQIFFVKYNQLEDQTFKMLPSGNETSECVDTFTIRHPSVEISTTSSQYVMLLDIINNVLLHKEPSKKESLDRMNKMKFSLQLSNIEDYQALILSRQEKVRQMILAIRQLERDLFLALKAQDNSTDSVTKLRSSIRETKDQLKETNQELSVLISLYKENQFPASPLTSKTFPRKNHAVLCVEVWLDEAHWSTTDRDGQIEIAHVHLINCKYNRHMFSDDSGEHCFELESFKVQDLSPNAMYTDVLFPLDKKVRVDKEIRLRVFSRDKAPVAGITVKEHFEVNVVPLAVQLTSHFYDALFEFFFPSREDQGQSHSSEMAHMIVGAGSRHQGSDKRPEDQVEQDKKSKRKAHSDSHKKRVVGVSDVDTMTERALEVKTFLYVKIPKVPLRISYHGRQGGIPIDIDNFNVSIPTLEYHSQNWTWKDMFMAIKKDCKQAIIPKAIKTKLGMESHGELSNEATASVNILGIIRNPQDQVRSSKRLFGAGRKGQSRDPSDRT